MKLIDAEALYKEIVQAEDLAMDRVVNTNKMIDDRVNPLFIRYSAQLDERTIFKYMITDAPTIEAEPVRHGKWIIRDNPGTGWYRVTCSECGEDVTSTAPCIGFFPNAKVTWDYCPSCGARMDDND